MTSETTQLEIDRLRKALLSFEKEQKVLYKMIRDTQNNGDDISESIAICTQKIAEIKATIAQKQSCNRTNA